MKVLFADASNLCRYSTILVVKECVPNLAVLEAETLDETYIILATEKVEILFINTNILRDEVINCIKSLRDLQQNLRIILVINTKAEYYARKHIGIHVDGILQLEDSLQNTQAYIKRLLNNDQRAHEQKRHENRCYHVGEFPFVRTEGIFKAYNKILDLCWSNQLALGQLD
ncbi:hypothetical protein [Sphingobacterium corticibacter]|uniref:DNA-binding response regulator n=1 Tax=Sphingobacterium corticibacter TaxID=2171749 RepID=A0A2T8HHX1_9SPHI|nr:hypothetical protein [Sphingobacterium corticibacter]PVH25034.1 hypothetical protein DC487_08855 [Sphingobacterium corticibacter]